MSASHQPPARLIALALACAGLALGGCVGAQPTAEAADHILRLGECLSEGPLEAAEVVLIGHADPWGDGDYNRTLAERRAQSVARLLRAEGVEGERIAVQSRGERAARAQPDHRPVERRVDIAVKL